MTIQNIVADCRRAGDVLDRTGHNPGFCEVNVFRSLMDREYESVTTRIEYPCLQGLKTVIPVEPINCLTAGRRKLSDTRYIDKILLSVCVDIVKLPVKSAKIQISLDLKKFGILHIEAIRDVSGIHVRLSGNPLFQKAIAKKFRLLNVYLSDAAQIPTEIMWYGLGADKLESSAGELHTDDCAPPLDNCAEAGQEYA